MFKNCETIAKYLIYNNLHSRRKRKENKRNIWGNNDWEIPTIIDRHQTTDLETREDTKQNTYLIQNAVSERETETPKTSHHRKGKTLPILTYTSHPRQYLFIDLLIIGILTGVR